MSSITLHGQFSRTGIASDPVIFIDTCDRSQLDGWWKRHGIFTKPFFHPHPDTRVSYPVIYIGKRAAGLLQEGDRVMITIDIRPETRGNGIKTVDVVRAEPG